MKWPKGILWIVMVGVQVCLAGQVRADEDDWPSLEKAFTGRLLQVVQAPSRALPIKDEAFPFILGDRCPRLPVNAMKLYGVKVQFERKRSHRIGIAVGRLPEGLDIYGSIVAASDPAREEGCLLSKAGGALMQFGHYLLVFPTYGKDSYYSYMRSLPLVIKALRDFWGDRAPRKFILTRGGTGEPQALDIEDYLKTYGDKRSR